MRKGWGVETEAPREGGTFGNKPATTNGMGYHRGPVMHANPVNVYFIWYGIWTNGPKPSDSQTTVNPMDALFEPTRGIAGSSYFRINTTYSDTTGYATGDIAVLASSTQ
jgi:hypothetical protein